METQKRYQTNQVKFLGSWFDLHDFATQHPGGRAIIQLFEGRDVTHAFRSYHPHLSDIHFRTKFQVGSEDIDEKTIGIGR